MAYTICKDKMLAWGSKILTLTNPGGSPVSYVATKINTLDCRALLQAGEVRPAFGATFDADLGEGLTSYKVCGVGNVYDQRSEVLIIIEFTSIARLSA